MAFSGSLSWRRIDPIGKITIYNLYHHGHEILLEASANMIKEFLFEGGFGFRYGPSQQNKKNGKSKPDHESIEEFSDVDLVWIEDFMKTAYDYYMMYGLCPYRKIINPVTGNQEITIPSTLHGDFVVKLTDQKITEVGFVYNSSLEFYTSTIGPDPDIKVFVWAGRSPSIHLDSEIKFNSIISRLLPTYNSIQELWTDDLIAAYKKAHPTLFVEHIDSKMNLDAETEGKIVEYALGSNSSEKSMEHNVQSQRDSEAFLRIMSHNERTRETSHRSTVIGFDNQMREVISYRKQNWQEGNICPIPHGLKTTSAQIAQQPSDFIYKIELWQSTVCIAFGLTVDIVTKGGGAFSSRSRGGSTTSTKVKKLSNRTGGNVNSTEINEQKKRLRRHINNLRKVVSSIFEIAYSDLIENKNAPDLRREIANANDEKELHIRFIEEYKKKNNITQENYIEDIIEKDNIQYYTPLDKNLKLSLDQFNAVLGNITIEYITKNGKPPDIYQMRNHVKDKIRDSINKIENYVKLSSNIIHIKWIIPPLLDLSELIEMVDAGIIDPKYLKIMIPLLTGIPEEFVGDYIPPQQQENQTEAVPLANGKSTSSQKKNDKSNTKGKRKHDTSDEGSAIEKKSKKSRKKK